MTEAIRAELETKTNAIGVLMLENETQRRELVAARAEAEILRGQLEAARLAKAPRVEAIEAPTKIGHEIWKLVGKPGETISDVGLEGFRRLLVSRVRAMKEDCGSATFIFDALWRVLNPEKAAQEPDWTNAYKLFEAIRVELEGTRRDRDRACDHLFVEARRRQARVAELTDDLDAAREQVRRLRGVLDGSSTAGLEALEALWADFAHRDEGWGHPAEVVELVTDAIARQRKRVEQLGRERLGLYAILTKIYRASTLDPSARWVEAGEVAEAFEDALRSERLATDRERTFSARSGERVRDLVQVVERAAAVWNAFEPDVKAATRGLGELLTRTAKGV